MFYTRLRKNSEKKKIHDIVGSLMSTRNKMIS